MTTYEDRKGKWMKTMMNIYTNSPYYASKLLWSCPPISWCSHWQLQQRMGAALPYFCKSPLCKLSRSNSCCYRLLRKTWARPRVGTIGLPQYAGSACCFQSRAQFAAEFPRSSTEGSVQAVDFSNGDKPKPPKPLAKSDEFGHPWLLTPARKGPFRVQGHNRHNIPSIIQKDLLASVDIRSCLVNF